MSVDASAHVIRCSPFRGATFLVHLMIADVANDAHDHEIFLSQARLAKKCRLSRTQVNHAFAELEASGWLTLLENRARQGKPNMYRFEYVDAPVVYDSEQKSTGGCGVFTQTTGVSSDTTPGVKSVNTELKRTQLNTSSRQGVKSVNTPPGFTPGVGFVTNKPECDKCDGMGVVEQADGSAVECECKGRVAL